MNDFESKLTEVFCRVMGITPQDLQPQTPRDQLSYWKSIKHINLIVEVEKSFAVEIPSSVAVGINSYQALRLTLGHKLQIEPIVETSSLPQEDIKNFEKPPAAVKRGFFNRFFS